MDRMAIRAASFSGVDNSAQATVKLLDEQTTRPVREWVVGHQAAIQAAVPGKITQEQATALIAKFTAAPDFNADRTGRMLTFGDLKLLHTLEPAKFKELTLTGWNKTAGEETYFNAADTPNMPVAFAGRISMSIPIYFQTAVYQGNQYMDGGVGSNMPSEVVLKNKQGAALEEAQARTMLMAFDDSGKSFATQFTSGRLDLVDPAREEDMAHGIMQRTTGADFAGTGVADKVKTYNSGPNVHVVFHGKVGTFDLNASEARQAFAKQTASIRTLDQIQARQNQAYQMTVANHPAAILGVLSADERRAIANGGAPTQAQYPRAQDLAVARTLYDSCALEFLPD
jgi:predicted acylesterase/phospholipase RssA